MRRPINREDFGDEDDDYPDTTGPLVDWAPVPPPYRPDYSLIACRGCGRRLYDDDGNKIKLPWWQVWKWGC